jgi:O-antigen ligase
MLNYNLFTKPISGIEKLILSGLIILPLIPWLGALIWGITIIYIWYKNYPIIIKNSLNLSLILLGIWLIITCFFAFKPEDGFLGLVNILPFFGLFIGFKLVIKKVEQLFIMAWLMVFPSIIIVILGLGQLFLNWSTPEVISPFLGWTLRVNGVPEGRMNSIFIYANLFAIYLLIIFVITLGLWINYYRKWQQSKHKKLSSPLLFLSFAISLHVIGLILTNSRNAWIIATLAFLVYTLYLSWYWLVGTMTFIISCVLYASFGSLPGQDLVRKIVPDYFWMRLADTMYSDRPIATLRVTQWRFTLKMTKDRPLFGWGLRNFSPLYEAQTNTYLGHPHNLFLMFSAETGIFGLLGFLGIVGWIYFQAIESLKNLAQQNRKKDHLILFTYLTAFSSCVLFNLFDVTIFDIRVNALSWFLLACICGVSEGFRGCLKSNKDYRSTP